MATRRNRIKGIANIPQRRKVESKPSEDPLAFAEPETINPESETILTNNNGKLIDKSVVEEVSAQESTSKSAEENNVKVPESTASGKTEAVLNIKSLSTLKIEVSRRRTFIKPIVNPKLLSRTPKLNSESTNHEEIKTETSIRILSAEILPSNTETESSLMDQNENSTTSNQTRRRTFIKPIVNPKLLSRKPKLKLEAAKQEEIKTENADTTEILPSNSESSPIEREQNENSSMLHQTPPVKPNMPPESIKSSSDIEYPVGPLSPTKLLNRSRIKAVPRLGQRRTSMTLHGSASESEDDGRKNYKRIRTESSCSTTASITNELQIRTDPGSPQKSKEFSSIIQRKCKRTEQSRKMAEARRHFLHKFGNQTPDKQKLTMIDLIFYNPTTNPMCQKPKKQSATIEEIVDDENLQSEEKFEESKQSDDVCIESDEENVIPAPQIKIGANGEIVVDEKSLIIENIETKRGREELQKSKIIDGDFDTGYGIYKREKRSKDWSKEETLRFYKALNTLGPDFSLMVELFEGRSRRELKMKFKKEERVNRLLIDKALTQPVQFDITELRKELIEEQKKMEEEALKRTLKLSVKKPIPYYGQRCKRALGEKQNRKQMEMEQPEQKPHDIYSKLEKGIACLWESDTEEEDSDVLSTKPYPELKPTRSGRIPKPRQPYTPKDLTLAKRKRQKHPNPVDQDIKENTLKDLNALQPGSIMIVTSQTPTGEPTFKVFMVTPTQNKIPITLTPDMLTNLTQSTEEPSIEDVENIPTNNVSSIPSDECNITIPAEENNITIPAEENVEISTDAFEHEMWPYEHTNISVPVDNDIVPPDNENISLCNDGKYDVKLTEEWEEVILGE